MMSFLVIGGGLLQVPAIKMAQKMGLKVIVTDKNPNAVGAALADQFVQLNTVDAEGHAKLAGSSAHELIGVLAEGISAEYSCARAAKAANLPGLDPDTAYRIANKDLSRAILSSAGIPQPKFVVVDGNNIDLTHAFDALADREVVLKAVDNCGSRGFVVLDNVRSLTKEIIEQTVCFSTNRLAVVEERLFGTTQAIAEQSVETVWQDGKGYWLNWVDRAFSRPGMETEVRSSAEHNYLIQRRTEQVVLAAGKALGMTTGIFKCDVLQTETETFILETAARLSGGFDCQFLTPIALGCSYIRGAIKLAIQNKIDWSCFMPRRHNRAIAKWIFLPSGERITEIKTDEAEKLGFVFTRCRVGEVVPQYKNCADRSLVLIAGGRSFKDADAKILKMEKSLVVKTERTV